MSTKRDILLADLNAAEAAELDAYHELVAAQERHRRLADKWQYALIRLGEYDERHPEEIPVVPELPDLV